MNLGAQLHGAAEHNQGYQALSYVGLLIVVRGPSIKYVTLFLANFAPSPCHTLSHIRGSPRKYVTPLGSPRFLVDLVQKSRTKAPCTNSISILRGGFCPAGFCQRVFCLEGLSGLVFVRSPTAVFERQMFLKTDGQADGMAHSRCLRK